MKTCILALAFYLTGTSLSIGQDIVTKAIDNSFAFYLDSPLFYRGWFGEKDYYIMTINFEYQLKKSTTNKTLFSLGYGREYLIRNLNYNDIVITSEIKNISGKKNHYFEKGIGLSYASLTLMLMIRLGYRIEIANNWLFRAAYTPYLWLEPHLDTEYDKWMGFNSFSVSIGYRFGKPRNKVKGNNSF